MRGPGGVAIARVPLTRTVVAARFVEVRRLQSDSPALTLE
jgi:hypothetical protein